MGFHRMRKTEKYCSILENRWGRLLSSYAVNLTKSEQSGSGGTGSVSDEEHLFDPTDLPFIPIKLNKINIDSTTIEVKDAGGIPYVPIVDYTITANNRISVVPFGLLLSVM